MIQYRRIHHVLEKIINYQKGTHTYENQDNTIGVPEYEIYNRSAVLTDAFNGNVFTIRFCSDK